MRAFYLARFYLFVVHYHASMANNRSVGCLVGFVPFYVKYEKERVDATSRCRLPTRSNPTLNFHKQKAYTRVDIGFSWRRMRDSNPRGREPKRFSRPPRYDRFDNPPYRLNYFKTY